MFSVVRSLSRDFSKCDKGLKCESCVFLLLKEAIKVIQPFLLWKIIQYFENYDPVDQSSLHAVYGYAAAMSLSAFGLTFLQHLYYYHVQRIGMKIRVAMCHMIYKKVRSLHTWSLDAVFLSMSCNQFVSSGSGPQQRIDGKDDHRADCESSVKRRESFR